MIFLLIFSSLIGVSLGQDEPMCQMHFPGALGCGTHILSSRQTAPCYDPRDPQSLGASGVNKLKQICPKFANEHEGEALCCNTAQVNSLADKFEKMFTSEPIFSGENGTDVYSGLFHNCPACVASQQEYYCEMFCSPVQSTFLNVTETFDASSPGPGARDKVGVAQFEVKLPKSFTDKVYESCRNVKQIWFEGVENELIPQITVNIIEQRFCKNEKNCDGQKWLSAQGTTTQGWPRFGVLNTVIHTEEDSNDLDDLVTECDEECGCLNCLSQCPEPEFVDLSANPRSDYFERQEYYCAVRPSCGKNLYLPNGSGLTRQDVPCLITKDQYPTGYPATVLRDSDEDEEKRLLLARVRETCPVYLNNHQEGTAICCNIDQISTLYEETAQVRQLFGRCPACLKTMEMVYCHTTCHPSQSMWMMPKEGFKTVDQDGIESIGIHMIDFYWSEELMNGIWETCKDVSFTQTNGKVIEDLMCDGNAGADCTVERFLNFNGGTDNGFSPYNLVYNMVTPNSPLRSFLSNRTDVVLTENTKPMTITEDELAELDPELVPLDRKQKSVPGQPPLHDLVFDCDQAFTDLTTGEPLPSCSCTDCELACPGLAEYPEPEPRATIGPNEMDLWIFIAIIISVSLIAIFVLILVLRKVCKEKKKVGGIEYVSTEQNQKTVYEEDIGCLDRLSLKTHKALSSAFYWWAKNVVCRFPLIVMIVVIGGFSGLLVGMKDIEFTTDPIRLWASENSRSFVEYDKFNNYFVPFYRASQVIATLKPPLQGNGSFYDTFGDEYTFNNILNKEYWKELYDLSMEARDVVATCEKCSEKGVNGTDLQVTWDEVCFNPLSDPDDPTAGGCSLFSVFQYWQNDWEKIQQEFIYEDRDGVEHNTTYLNHILYCTRTPSALTNKYYGLEPCGADFGSPVFPFLAIGGYNATTEEYWEGEALILSYINRNVEDKFSDEFYKVEAWEGAFLQLMKDSVEANRLKNFDIAFFSERSIEDEIDATTESDLPIFIASYTIIFFYIMTVLGSYTSFKRIPVDMKITLAVGGILMILLSALAATGVFGWAKVASNLIVMEVVPFLLLAIGADNVFILVMDIQREKRNEGDTNSDIIARVLSRGGPSMLLCALTESTVFFIGSISDMPAVKIFALNAALAILFNFILQVTAFLALIKFDMDRMDGNRWDVIFCVKSSTEKPTEIKQSPVQKFFTKYYTPILMNDLVGFSVVALFIAWLGASIYQITIADIGLDQSLSVPLDSYVADYFDYMETYLMVGVPVYFIIEGKFDYHKPDPRSLVCSYAGCDLYSLAEQISRAAKQTDISKIATSATVWVDDYDDWLSPSSGCCFTKNCCRPSLPDQSTNSYHSLMKNLGITYEEGECLPEGNYPGYEENGLCSFCNAKENGEAEPIGPEACRKCFNRLDTVEESDFNRYLDFFLIDNPNEFCSKGGHASYGDALSIVREESAGNGTGPVDYIQATYFMAYHPVCAKSYECQQNLEAARYLADQIEYDINMNLTRMEKSPGQNYTEEDFVSVWPYSIYYPYYEQYITMTEDAVFQIGICLIPAFVLTFVLLGFDIVSGLIVIATVTMIIIDTYGMCSLWGVDFNALTLINLIAAIGLSIEFTGHTVRTFALTTKSTRKERVIETMGVMGPAVMLGVAFTNLPGIICLHWASAQIIEIFFFRMNFVTTLVGIAHGLIFIPVILAYFGPNVNKALLYEQQQEATKGRSETMNATSKKDSSTEMKSKGEYPSATNVKSNTERTEL